MLSRALRRLLRRLGLVLAADVIAAVRLTDEQDAPAMGVLYELDQMRERARV